MGKLQSHAGDICDAIYADNCYFADPTVSFSGLAKWRRNLKLLVPFLISPTIDLLSLGQLPRGEEAEGPIRLQVNDFI